MMDDVITLKHVTGYIYDSNGNETAQTIGRTVFCRVDSVTRSEYYAAAQNNLHPSYVFVLSNYMDYQGEKTLTYIDWTGAEKEYDIVRTYRTGDSIELTAEERISHYGQDK